MTASPGVPRDARNISNRMMMSGCCNYVTTTTFTFLLFLIVPICFVESRDLRIKKRFTRDDICNETIKTGKIVRFCPEDVESRNRRSRERKCEVMHDSCSKDSLVYHCVRSGNNLIEVCAPRNFITGKCCVQFNEGLGRIVEDYGVTCSECPFHYYSNESIKYPSCFQSIMSITVSGSTIQPTVEVTSKHLTSDETSSRFNSSSTSPIRTKCRTGTGRGKRHINNNCEIATTTVNFNQSNEKNTTSNENKSHMDDADFTMVLLFVTLTVFIIFGIGAVFFILKGNPRVKAFYRKHNNGQLRSKIRKNSFIHHDIRYKQARDDDPVKIQKPNVF